MSRQITTPEIKRREYDELFRQICCGEFVLLVGSDVMLNPTTMGGISDSKEYIFKRVSATNNIRGFENYDDFVNNYVRGRQLVKKFLPTLEPDAGDISPALLRLLRTKCFRLVMTTATDPYIEKAMEIVWQGNYRVLDRHSSDKLDIERIACNADEYYDMPPTLYYVFGSGSVSAKNCAITEIDHMEDLAEWIKNPPKNLKGYLGGKNLLSIGGNTEDWLFRYLWYVLRGKGDQSNVAMSISEETPLYNFLIGQNVNIHNDIDGFLSGLCDSISRPDPSRRRDLNRFAGGVFISYPREDETLARYIWYRLNEQGYNVWLDYPPGTAELESRYVTNYLAGLMPGDDYDSRIRNAIRQCKVFIPLLTPRVLSVLSNHDELNRRYFVNVEWAEACKNGNCNIIPIVADIDGTDFSSFVNAGVPTQFHEKTQVYFTRSQPYDMLFSAISKILNS